MGRFVKKILSFSLLSLVIFLAADLCYSRIIRKVKEPNMEVWRDVMEGEASADILISGDSMVNTDCYPPVIDSITGLKSFSGGVIGHHLTIQKLRYDMYMTHYKKPVALVQFVDIWSFAPMSDYDRLQFLPWIWNAGFLKRFISLEPLNAFKMSFPWFRYHGSVLERREWVARTTNRGFFTYEKNDPFLRLADSSLDFSYDSRNDSFFRSFLSEVYAEGIKLALVIAPAYESYDFPKEYYDRFRGYFRGIAEEYGIPFLDYTEMSLCGNKSCFLDAVHLNLEGAKVFSDSLANDIASLGLISNCE